MIRRRFYIWAPWIINRILSILNTLYSIFRVIYKECFINKELIFLNSSVIPISSQSFGLIENTNVKWRCSLNPVLMIDPYETIMKEKHLSYLGFTIKIPGVNDIDISSWINDVRYIGQVEPSFSEIFVIWCFDMGVSYLQYMDSITVEIIDEMGDILVKGLNDK